jgi:hypothetical protein
MKKSFWHILLFLSGLAVFGQLQLQKVVAASGCPCYCGEAVLSRTTCEPVIYPLSADGKIRKQSFQQSGLEVTVIKNLDGLPYTIEAYPNPTGDLVLIQLKNSAGLDFQYMLYDMNGKVLEQKKLKSDISAINMKKHPDGTYLLKIMQPDKEITTFEIVKH